MEEIKIYQQIDSQSFHIGTNADLVPGALDIESPVYDSTTHKAKWVDNAWVIKPILEWDLKEGQILEVIQEEVKTIDEMTLEETISYVDKYSIKTIEKPSIYHSWVDNQWVITENGLNNCKNDKLKYLADFKDKIFSQWDFLW